MTEEEVIDAERREDVDRCCQVSSRFSFDPRDIMNFISREETSVIRISSFFGRSGLTPLGRLSILFFGGIEDQLPRQRREWKRNSRSSRRHRRHKRNTNEHDSGTPR